MPARTDLLDIIRKAIEGQTVKRELGGTFTERALDDLHRFSSMPENPVYLTRHGMTERFLKDNWTPEQIAEAYTKILGSEKTRGVPNPLSPGRRTPEALWLCWTWRNNHQ